jgi:hypothetical protein
MKTKIATALIAAVFASSASAADDAKKGMFYLSLTTMSRDLAAYTFMLDELLTVRCGASPSIEHLKTATESYIYVLIALKDGNTSEAKSRLAAIPCEKTQK